MITVMFHGNRVRGLPHLSDRQFKDANGQVQTERCAVGDTTILRPGKNEIPESLLEDYQRDPEIKALLFKGAMNGLEIVAVDGKPCDHEAVLQAIYPPAELPGQAERMRAAALEIQREAELATAALKPIPDEHLPANLPISTPESESGAPDPTPSALAAKLEGELKA